VATPGVFISDIATVGGPGRANVTIDLRSVGDDQIVSVSVTFLKRLNNQIILNFMLSKIKGEKTKKMFQAPKLNYCDMRRHGSFVPILSDLIKVVHGPVIWQSGFQVPGRTRCLLDQ
jgi:hypothetical protein